VVRCGAVEGAAWRGVDARTAVEVLASAHALVWMRAFVCSLHPFVLLPFPFTSLSRSHAAHARGRACACIIPEGKLSSVFALVAVVDCLPNLTLLRVVVGRLLLSLLTRSNYQLKKRWQEK
jgi:hypothetical protein